MNKRSKLPSPEALRRLLVYEPNTGRMFWKPREADFRGADGWNARHAGKEAFTCVHKFGYRTGSVAGVFCKAHRVAWAIHHGEAPPWEIDHINGERADNRIVNLRAVTRQENARNARLSSANTSGVTGVCWERSHKSWKAHIRADGRTITLGRYKLKDDAIAARKAAEAKFDFHPNHGRRAA